MNEAFRVLKHNGTFYAITPVYPREEAFIDPTHINFITKKTHRYFTFPNHYAKMYGFNGNFEVKRAEVIRVIHETKKIKKIKLSLKDIFYGIFGMKKTHVLWEFKAIKEN